MKTPAFGPKIPILVGLMLLSLLAGCSKSRMATVQRVAPPEPAAIVITNVSVFDGENLLQGQDVLIRGKRIESVSPIGSQLAEKAAQRIDGRGRTLLPGLIDSHVHLSTAGGPPWSLRRPDIPAISRAFLYAGVTSVLVAQHGRDELKFEQKAALDKLLAPHLYLAGPGLTAPEGHPVPLFRDLIPWPLNNMIVRGIPTASTPDEAREHVRKIAAGQHPPFFKIFYDAIPPESPQISIEVLRATITEAKDKGMRPVVHVGRAADMVAAAEAGASLLMHSAYVDQLSEEQVKRMAELKVPFVPTLQAFQAGADKLEGRFTAFEREMVDPKLIEAWGQRPKDWEAKLLTDLLARFPEYQANLKHNVLALYRAGVPLHAGTDTGVPGLFPGAGLHTELAALAALGIPAIDLLRSATSRPGAFLEPDGSLGRIAPGQRADLLLVRGDPTQDISALDAIEEVFLNGERLERHKP